MRPRASWASASGTAYAPGGDAAESAGGDTTTAARSTSRRRAQAADREGLDAGTRSRVAHRSVDARRSRVATAVDVQERAKTDRGVARARTRSGCAEGQRVAARAGLQPAGDAQDARGKRAPRPQRAVRVDELAGTRRSERAGWAASSARTAVSAATSRTASDASSGATPSCWTEGRAIGEQPSSSRRCAASFCERRRGHRRWNSRGAVARRRHRYRECDSAA